MNGSIVLAFLLMSIPATAPKMAATPAAVATHPSTTATPTRKASWQMPDAMLRRYHSIDAALPPGLRSRTSSAISSIIAASQSQPEMVLTILAQKQAHGVAPKATAAQAAVLANYLVLAAITTVQNNANADSEVSSTSSMQLQMLMDERSKLLQTASDMEKSMSDTDTAIVGNIKQ